MGRHGRSDTFIERVRAGRDTAETSQERCSKYARRQWQHAC